MTSRPGDLRFPNYSDDTTKLNRDQFARGHPLLDSCMTDQVPSEAVSEAVFWTKTGFQRALGRKSEACET